MSWLKPRHVLPAVIAFALVAGVIDQGTTASDAIQRPKATTGNNTKTSTRAGTTTAATSATSTTGPSTTTAGTVYTPPPSIASSTTSPSSTTAGTVYTPPQSLASSCSTDVAAAVNSWIGSIPNGTASSPSIVSFPSSGCYEVESTILIWQRQYLDIEGHGAHFIAKTNGTCQPYIYQEKPGVLGANYCNPGNLDRSFLDIDHSSNVTIDGLDYTGSNGCAVSPYSRCYDSSLEGQAGFLVNSSNHVSIAANTISHVWGDCMQIGSSYPDFTWPDSDTFDTNACDHMGRHGWSSGAASNLHVQNNSFSTVAYDGVDLEDDINNPTSPVGCVQNCGAVGWANITASGDTFDNVGLVAIAVQGGQNCTGEHIHFDHETFKNSPLIFEAGTISPNPYFGDISLTNSSGALPFQSSYQDSVELTNVNGALISGNTLTNSAYGWSSSGAVPCSGGSSCVYQQPYGIAVWSSDNATISGNTVQQAANVVEVDASSHHGQFAPSGAPSQNIVVCGNSTGTYSNPQRQPAC